MPGFHHLHHATLTYSQQFKACVGVSQELAGSLCLLVKRPSAHALSNTACEAGASRRYCRIVAADLLALLAMDAEGAADILALGALPLLAALLNLRHSPGVRCPPPCFPCMLSGARVSACTLCNSC